MSPGSNRPTTAVNGRVLPLTAPTVALARLSSVVAIKTLGTDTVIEFPAAVAQSQMPPLFVDGPDGKPTSLVNYRVAGQRIVVDRLFQKAELKIGQGRGQQKVDIERLRRP